MWPARARMLPLYPDIQVELHADNAIADIVADRFGAGVRQSAAFALLVEHMRYRA